MSSESGVAGLVIQGLTKRFGSVAAVDGISFTVGAGEFVSLLGPSGCGKTTTLRCIAGFERPDHGTISIDGQVVVDAERGVHTPPNRRHFGMVFQSYAIWPHMTVLANVGYPLRVQGKHSRADIRAKVNEKLRTVGLEGYESRYPSQLSGGQQQRVALARALVMEPRALLFDEPLSNLDAKLRERMRFELIEIQSQLGIPAVYVTHDQAEAMVMSSKVIVMESGRIAQSGTPEEIYVNPVSRFVADFIGLSNFIQAEVVGPAAGRSWRVRSALGQHVCTGDGTYEAGATVLLAVRPEQISLESGPSADEGAFTAKLRSRYFLGPYSEYFLNVGGLVLRVQTSRVLNLDIGGTVHGRILAQHCQIVEREGATN